MYFDIQYFIFLIPGLLLGLWAQMKVKSTFAKYNKVPTEQGITGAQAARQILDYNGMQHVPVEMVAGSLTDHFDPRTNVVRLSAVTFGSTSVGAVGVAAHEVGHAVQHAEKYTPMRVRGAILPVSSLGSSLSVPIILAGFLLQIAGLIYVGIALFALVVLFQLVTLPVEFNASSRAVQTLVTNGMMSQEETKGVQKVLNAAALTYVAAMLTSLLQLLYYVSLAGRRRN